MSRVSRRDDAGSGGDAAPASAAPAATARPGWRESALAPFATPVFFAVWLASLASNFGTLIQSVGAAWLMTSLSRSSDLVALVQAATALPIMLLSMPAGAIADISDRRSVMLGAQCFMLCGSIVLTVLAFAGLLTPWLLLALTFVLGCGSALYGPAWQSSVGEMVSREQLPAAVALNSLGFNIARTAGPAIGGLIVAGAGAPAAFLFNALSYVGLITVLTRWRRPHPKPMLPPEDIVSAMGAGLRYVRMSPTIRTVLFRAFVFGLLGSAIWALMPLVARDLVAGGPLTYGLLLGAFGGGAVAGALASQQIRARYSTEAIVSISTATFGLATLVAAHSPWLALTMLFLVAGGAAWVLALSTFNIATQTSAPRWVVGRSLAVYQMSAFGGIALGSWAWGVYAEQAGLVASLTAAGAALLASLVLARLMPLRPHELLPLDPARVAGDLHDHLDVPPHSGPVVIAVDYRIAAEDREAFVTLMREMRRIRRRDGAHRWRLLQDAADQELWTERWQTATWLEHLRQLHRATVADRETRERILALHRGPAEPRVRHMIERQPDESHESERERPQLRAGTTDPNLPSAEVPTELRRD